ncbi:hypothetical protein JEQ12_008651 [Ovis aries]|uniref:Uncharacterized protein n=1 Tax=Ovis aries TaxID=9940 RepID=A0A836AL89_SHEEP|nr:hypothetical protein JEQ12_008651 [Ovis aries]
MLLVLGAAGPGRGGAEPREAADRQTLLRLIVEIVQELRKYHSGESKRLQLSGRQDYTLDRREVADYAYPEEQRVETACPSAEVGAVASRSPRGCGAVPKRGPALLRVRKGFPSTADLSPLSVTVFVLAEKGVL